MPNGSGSLPVEYGFDPDGKVINRICREFKNVWELSGEALDYLQASFAETVVELSESWPEDRLVKMALSFLGVNYRVSLHEMAAMFELDRAVFDTEFITSVLVAVTNWPVWVEFLESKTEDEKKKPLSLVAA